MRRVRKCTPIIMGITRDGISFRYGESIPTTNVPERYIFNGNVTILIHKDKSKTIVKTMEGDEFDPVVGFLTAYFQKHSGLSKNKANDYLMEVRKTYEESIKEKSMYKEPKFKIGDRVRVKILHNAYGRIVDIIQTFQNLDVGGAVIGIVCHCLFHCV